jgi:hypothetical protein
MTASANPTYAPGFVGLGAARYPGERCRQTPAILWQYGAG